MKVRIPSSRKESAVDILEHILSSIFNQQFHFLKKNSTVHAVFLASKK